MHADPSLQPEDAPSVPPGDDSNDDPTPPLPADDGEERRPVAQNAAEASSQPAVKEEPEINNESDLPSDGRDPVGEAMIEQVNKPLQTDSRLERH